MLAIVDYGAGNLRSLRNAFDYVGIDAEVVDSPTRLAEFSHIVLPGVGAFGKAMSSLVAAGFREQIIAHANDGRPLLGICLGMQILATRGTEFGDHEGLGLIPGRVVPLVPSDAFPTPHVGWNSIDVVRKHPLLGATRRAVDYYFVHSFHFVVDDGADTIARSDYGVPFDAIVGRQNVVGIQFHPEKSQAGGLALLEGFASWDGKC